LLCMLSVALATAARMKVRIAVGRARGERRSAAPLARSLT
jgi:hypothetical protein